VRFRVRVPCARPSSVSGLLGSGAGASSHERPGSAPHSAPLRSWLQFQYELGRHIDNIDLVSGLDHDYVDGFRLAGQPLERYRGRVRSAVRRRPTDVEELVAGRLGSARRGTVAGVHVETWVTGFDLDVLFVGTAPVSARIAVTNAVLVRAIPARPMSSGSISFLVV
jgi:hypothetical protein